MTKSTELATQYRPAEIEPDVRAKWDATHAFHADPTAAGDPYCIVIPPPNVTAALHMGHALNNTLQDILTRYHRMAGDNTLWMPGTDHAGIATQTIVDKRLRESGEPALADYKKKELAGENGREQFLEKVQAWKDEYEARITEQLQAMGCSCDWERQRFTMDPVCAAAVREAFFQLFKDGLIYRGKRLVNWDPVSQTALADDEVEMQDIDGQFWYLKYPIVEQDADGSWQDTGEFVTVATTRPETMLGDTAVAVNPNDAAHKDRIGQHVRLPIVNRVIPIIGDDYVVMHNPEGDAKAQYASGFLKVTPAHDPNDYQIGQRHHDTISGAVRGGHVVINVMAPDASISKDHGWPADEWEGDTAIVDPFCHELLGMDRYVARKAIEGYFKQHDLLAEKKNYRHSVGHSYRSHVPVEPYLSDQWYVKVTDERLAGAALRAMAEDQRSKTAGCTWKEGDSFTDTSEGAAEVTADQTGLRFIPERYGKTFQTWHENIRDWCISRQLWWGHRIPVWCAPQLGFGESGAGQGTVSELNERLNEWESAGRIAVIRRSSEEADYPAETKPGDSYAWQVCVRNDQDSEVVEALEHWGYTQDPDVLDTWFSSALWPISTLGWPDPKAFPEDFPTGDAALKKWNPSNTLCTAREIITLWVSRMVMFNLYFRDCLPFKDVFIHAMIQDGHGQKMSKSLGNGVDPLDIIHSHGSDAMRYTLCAMTTQTQDVRMPVDMVCPHTGETFTPQFVDDSHGHKVAAPNQQSPGDTNKEMVSSYGVASGKALPTDDAPMARNTSEKFDVGRNFANKLWNAVRFALSYLEQPVEDRKDEPSTGEILVNQWILARLAQATAAADASIRKYEFKPYADGLYDFVWRDLCDWYIESVKPTLNRSPEQRQTLATVIDVSLRMLHPVMPFITERLWERLNDVAPDRGVEGVQAPPSQMLVNAAWPQIDPSLVDEDALRIFGQIQDLVTAVRKVRTGYQVPPKQLVAGTGNAPVRLVQKLLDWGPLIETLSNTRIDGAGPKVQRPHHAAATVVGEVEIYLHDLVDPQEEVTRLEKRLEELQKNVKQLRGRLSNESYVSKAPEKLVQQTRDQLTDAEREAEATQRQLADLKGEGAPASE